MAADFSERGDHGVVVLGRQRSSRLPLVMALHRRLRVSDLGVGLNAMKCKEICSLDLSHLPVSYCLAAKKAEESN
jgi:hypothetical protein